MKLVCWRNNETHTTPFNSVHVFQLYICSYTLILYVSPQIHYIYSTCLGGGRTRGVEGGVITCCSLSLSLSACYYNIANARSTQTRQTQHTNTKNTVRTESRSPNKEQLETCAVWVWAPRKCSGRPLAEIFSVRLRTIITVTHRDRWWYLFSLLYYTHMWCVLRCVLLFVWSSGAHNNRQQAAATAARM